MDLKNGVLCYKIVVSEKVDVDSIEFLEVSKSVRKVIQDTKIKSMQGLIGKNWQAAAHKLAKEYWGIK